MPDNKEWYFCADCNKYTQNMEEVNKCLKFYHSIKRRTPLELRLVYSDVGFDVPHVVKLVVDGDQWTVQVTLFLFSTRKTIQGRIKTKPCTLLRIETDDLYGEIKAIITEGKYTEDDLDTFGGFGVVEIPDLQNLLKSLCLGGFAHHVASTLNEVGDIVYEALTKYLGYNTEFHNKKN